MPAFSERETVKALGIAVCAPLPVLPGMTGTGAPVTEQPRCPVQDELGWYRVYYAPIGG